jgi:uncharacterized protein YbaA (DUF1428 family)
MWNYLGPEPDRAPTTSEGGVEMAKYVDGFIVPVKKRKLAEYRRLAARAAKVWMELGAVEYQENVADDVSWGKRTSFPRSVKLQSDEVVVFAWIGYKSRRDRDRINKKVLTDPRLADMVNAKTLPFDAKRMIYGGFKLMLRR